MIDFHAAHERIIFDKLTKGKIDLAPQSLLFPKIIELPIDEYISIIENLKLFSDSGIELVDLSDNKISIKTMPSIFKGSEPEDIIRDLIRFFNQEENPDIFKAVSSATACRMAKKAGDSISMNEAVIISEEIISGTHELRCPHGRPFVFKLDKLELEKMFKR